MMWAVCLMRHHPAEAWRLPLLGGEERIKKRLRRDACAHARESPHFGSSLLISSKSRVVSSSDERTWDLPDWYRTLCPWSPTAF